MKDNQKFTLGLVAVAVGLGLYMYLVESKGPAPSDSRDVRIWSLSESQASELKRLVVQADSQKSVFVREGDTWKIENLPGREVDQLNFKGPYDKLLDLTASRRLEVKSSEKATYGLDKPTASLTWGQDDSPYRLTFGAVTPSGDAVYTHVVKDDAIYTVPKYKVDEWKNLALTPPLLPPASPSPSPAASAAASGTVPVPASVSPSTSAAPAASPTAAASPAPSPVPSASAK
ncbi:MAG: DUF4340 domain-containing protein [Candidatus Sericytochromatia bacterium]|nr:DUF4340 domain-containing protein [Candidatus Sericytochromatia bacterium]